LGSKEDQGSPDYSPFAAQYAQSRPTYPADLFDFLSSLVDQHRLAWDCATGNGQAAIALAGYFDRVIATDVSEEQIRHAVPHPKIEYRAAPSEESGLADRSVDLTTVASAMHWFDLDRFYGEVRRAARPGGVLAAWSYHVGRMVPPFDRLFDGFYRDVLAPYFGAGAKLVDDRYESIVLPGEPVKAPDFHVNAAWNFDQMLAFIGSWSGTQRYIRDRGENPVPLIAGDLERIWGGRETVHPLRWPVYLKISRL
jgi:SAM-dependent methyltransferase